MTGDSRGLEARAADDRAGIRAGIQADVRSDIRAEVRASGVASGADGAGSGSANPAPRRGSRRRFTRWAVAISAAVTALGTAACAGPPSNGDVRSASLSQSHNNVFIVAREPSLGMNPAQLVQGFLQALTGDQKDPSFSVAQEYLTAGTQKNWIKPGSTLEEPTAIVDKFEVAQDDQASSDDKGSRAAPVQDTPPPVGTETTVMFNAVQVAELDQFGFYRVTPQAHISFPFVLKREAVGWRIEKLPGYRPIELDSFKRVYQTYQAALPVYRPGSGLQQMDQVYLTQATGKIDYTFNALAEAVLNGRDRSRSPLELAQPVRVSPTGTAEVDLKVPPGSAPDLDEVQSALMQTFRDATATPQLVGATPQVSAVLLTYQGCPSSICATQPLSSLGTGPIPTVYWVCPQTANSEAAVVAQAPGSPGAACTNAGPRGKPMVDLSGVKVLKDAPIAVRQTSDAARGKATTPTTVAVVVADTAKGSKGGSVVVAGDKTGTDRRTWYTTADVSKLTDLEWDPVDGTLWVVDKNTLYRVHDPGDREASADTRDQVPVPVGGAQLTRFKPAPDGRRAVVVSDVGTTSDSSSASTSTGGATCSATGGSTSACPAVLVTVDRGGDVPVLAQDSSFPLLPATLGQSSPSPRSTFLATATDAAWADGRTVVLLGTSGESNIPKLFKVYADGSQDSVVIDPEDAQPSAKHIAAATSIYNSRSALWIFSDGAAPSDPNSTFVYFKGHVGADSNPEPGASPVVATFAASG